MRINIDGRPSATAEAACEAALVALRAEGVAVDVMRRPAAATERIEGAGMMAPSALLDTYHSAREQHGDLDDAERERVLLTGQAMLRDVAQGGSVAGLIADRPALHIVFDRVTISGFGPFLNEVSYPLRQRGVRMVTGSNASTGSSTAAGSNGAGKTALVMAPLWALTGETDPRPEGGSTRGLGGADVIHHAAKEATVRLEGTANGERFVIERSAGKRKRGLSFEMGGVDHTGQDLSLTQSQIEERLVPAGLLQDSCFHGQHVMSIGSLIDVTDKDIKQAMGRLVHMDVWELLHEQAQQTVREAKQAIVAKKAEQEELTRFVLRLELECEHADHRSTMWHEGRAEKFEQARQEADEARTSVAESMAALAAAEVGLETALGNAAYMAARAPDTAEMVSLGQGEMDEETRKLEADYSEVTNALRDCDVEHARVVAEEQSWHERAQRAMGSAGDQAECERCLQPVDAVVLESGRQSLHDGAMEAEARRHRMEEQGRGLRVSVDVLAHGVSQARAEAAARVEAHAKQTAAVFAAERSVRTAIARGQVTMEALHRAQQELVDTHAVAELPPPDSGIITSGDAETDAAAPYHGGWAEGANAAALAVDRAAMMTHEISERAYRVARALATTARLTPAETDPHAGETARLQQRLAEERQAVASKVAEVQQLREDGRSAAALSDAFGRGGIQSYLLDEALSQLQARTAEMLEELSGGALTLALSATSEAKSGKKGRLMQKVSREIRVRLADGSMAVQSVRQCSGGERRRVALALALGFGELAAERSGVTLELLVLDEALQQMDEEGMLAAARLFKRLDCGTVLVVCQANSAISGVFDAVDTVVKEGDAASLQLMD